MIHDTPGKKENNSVLPVETADYKGPGSQNERKTSDIVKLFTEAESTLLDATIGVGETVTFGVTISSVTGAAIFPIFEVTLWEGATFAITGVLWPRYSSSTVTQSNWEVGAMGYSFTDIDDPSVYHNQSAVSWGFTLTNASGAPRRVIGKVRVRYILNRG